MALPGQNMSQMRRPFHHRSLWGNSLHIWLISWPLNDLHIWLISWPLNDLQIWLIFWRVRRARDCGPEVSHSFFMSKISISIIVCCCSFRGRSLCSSRVSFQLQVLKSPGSYHIISLQFFLTFRQINLMQLDLSIFVLFPQLSVCIS